jgi:hypothetical protein
MPQSSVLTLRAGETTANYPPKDYRGISYQPHLYGKPYAAWTSGKIVSWYATEGEARVGLAQVRLNGRSRAFVGG